MSMRRLAVTAALVLTGVLMAAQPAAASWLQQGTPAPSGASVWDFTAVSCTSTTSCMAVGNATGLLAESLSGSTWTLVNIPDPGGGQLTGISCKSASVCEAVGNFNSGGGMETLDGGGGPGGRAVFLISRRDSAGRAVAARPALLSGLVTRR